MALVKRNRVFLLACVLLLLCCYALVALLFGFRHEEGKLKSMAVTMLLILAFNCLILDSLFFVCLSLHYFCIRKSYKSEPRRSSAAELSRSDFLRLHIDCLRAQLLLTPEHRNEKKNIYYRAICMDLYLFVKYFGLVLMLVVVSEDVLVYHNTFIFTTILKQSRICPIGLDNLSVLSDVYRFIELVLIDAFSEGRNYNKEIIREPGWMHLKMAKLLSVVQLRQVRYVKKSLGLRPGVFSEQEFMPGWRLPHRKMHYVNKFWRIYGPWVPTQSDHEYSWLLPMYHYGFLNTYPEHSGYRTLLARTKPNGLRVLNYLRDQNWLDEKTAALFIDCTLYNVDSNIFSIISIMVEQTPFGRIEKSLSVESCKLLTNFEEFSYGHYIVGILYILQLIQFVKVLFLRAWYESRFLHSGWNIFDCFIIMLNFLVVFLVYVREILVADLLDTVESDDKVEFMDFRIPGQIHELGLIAAGFLISFTTVRIWKILHFANCFRLFTMTLSKAFAALFSITVFIIIFLFGFCISSYMINGNNSESFVLLIKSFTTAMTYSFGFGKKGNLEEMHYGGYTLGFLLYLVLMVAVSIFLINIFITLLCDYSATARKALREIEAHELNALSFFAFLCREYNWIYKFVQYLKRKARNVPLMTKQTVAENIEETLDEMEEALAANQQFQFDQPQEDFVELDEQKKLSYKAHDEKMMMIVTILKAQFQLLDRDLSIIAAEIDSDDDES